MSHEDAIRSGASHIYIETLRAIAETYEEAGMPVPLDIQARLVEAGDIIINEESTPE